MTIKKDIHKLGAWLERLGQDGVAIEHKILEWKQSKERSAPQQFVSVQEAQAANYPGG